MTQTIIHMGSLRLNWHQIVWLLLTIVSVCLGVIAGVTTLLQPQAAMDARKTPYEHRRFSFDYSNLTNDSIKIDSVKVLKRLVNMGGVRANGDGPGFSTNRGNCTAEALLKTQAHFVWWKRKDAPSAYVGLKDPSKRFRCSVGFPRFDVEAEAWRCHYTLQENDAWVGRFEGVVLKAPDIMPRPIDTLPPSGTGKWIQFQFRNLTGKEVWFSLEGGKLVHADSEIAFRLRKIPADGSFYGFSAYNHEGSIYRPMLGDSVELASSSVSVARHVPKQVIELPRFDPDIGNWYCYFTLNTNGIWEAKFEGVQAK